MMMGGKGIVFYVYIATDNWIRRLLSTIERRETLFCDLEFDCGSDSHDSD